MSFISFLAQGPKCPLLQEMKLDKQLSQVTITYGINYRSHEIIEGMSHSARFFSQHCIFASEGSIIKIDYSCINKVENIWKNFQKRILYTLSATAAVLAGLVTLSLSRVVTARFVIFALFGVGCVFILERRKTRPFRAVM